ncbi:calmodulin-lysine N-methyltransferase-like isoform X2 [Amphibalanus amphitrite]|uniref:calmodulin-lysine N-methyltransferase-like isoform X2 n=1 Tax=Amphibalanus amphitrite TaxID=1232801 RepID=UPI001C92A666|nr:calmodulin-lysine N-methyltransferase-like isoform X2 [Amphibalanus amphitrite]XP_043193214.1 calmodulin-lysine N-methyltransferase-like isoform X2 [Amphibalanus amphitrite]XP_043207657.1 calmodulin-lysine N-methyltransferase-like isoform X2 [Amphibalanus amphitrite]XP_043207658.1 calmodulin-lysine N-methyltransferase-like isoform X2 [Amphibalanus amphitrite]
MKSKRHWMVLSEALRRREAPVGSRSVVRQFQSLGVFDVSGADADADGPWMTYRLPGGAGPGLQIRHVERRLSASDLVGFNNTGNVCVWPSEEVLTVLCMCMCIVYVCCVCVLCMCIVCAAAGRRVALGGGTDGALYVYVYVYCVCVLCAPLLAGVWPSEEVLTVLCMCMCIVYVYVYCVLCAPLLAGVWPSEEVLTVLCAARPHLFDDKLVLEVGGGMTCLAGLTVAANTAARRVLLTDGNETAVQNVRCICERNRALFGATAVDVSRLRWTDPADVAALQDQCDVILSADCLFFDDARDSLADFIVAVLRPGGVALVVAPPRSGTLDRFALEALRSGLLVSRMEQYGPFLDSLIQSHRSDPTFDPNLHLPVLLELTKPLRGAC